MPGSAQARDGGRVAAVRGVQVTTPPGREPRQGGGGREHEVVVRHGQRDGSVGLEDGRRRVAGDQGQGLRTRPYIAIRSAGGANFTLVEHDSGRRRGASRLRSARLDPVSLSVLPAWAPPSNSTARPISAPTWKPTASTGRTWTLLREGWRRSSAGWSPPAGCAASPAGRARPGRPQPRHHRPRGRAAPPPQVPPPRAYHRLARRCRSAISSGRSSSTRWVRRTSANRWW